MIVPESCEQIAGMQITGDDDYGGETVRQMVALASLFRGRQVHSVLDLGCGLGRASVGLHMLLDDASVAYHLVDYDQVDAQLQYGWNPPDRYNRLSLTNDFCRANRLPNCQVHDLAAPHWRELRDIDVVISLYAVGFHWSIEPYVPVLAEMVTDDALLVFQVAKQVAGRGSAAQRQQNRELPGARIVNEEYLVMTGGDIKQKTG